jgi:hypothetical protein
MLRNVVLAKLAAKKRKGYLEVSEVQRTIFIELRIANKPPRPTIGKPKKRVETLE